MKKINQKLFIVTLLSLLFGILITQTTLANEKRVALVIGNSHYQSSPLANPVNDARLMASNLTSMGFQVILKTDATQAVMDDAIEQFGRKLEEGGVGLFFYAGHGVQSKGRNYLIPIGAKLNREKDLKYRAVDAGSILDEMGNADNGLNIVVLDACRDNPLSRSFRSSGRGLKRMEDTPTGLLLAYSTAPGKVAADGDGRNSPYTKALVQAMKQPGLPLELVFKDALKTVKRSTRGKQIPWFNSSVEGDFYFSGAGQSHLPAPIQVASADPDEASKYENNFWRDVQNDPSQSMYEAYLAQYPDGHYARIAQIKLKKYQTPATPNINQQLSTCKAHINANRLTSGRGGNALACYEDILSTKPNNTQALAGLKQIEDKYAGWAKSQINKGRYSKAKTYLKKIALINPESEQLSELEEQLSQKEALAQQSAQPVNRPRTRTGSTGGARSITDNVTGMKLVKIPSGCFQMGSNNGSGDEKPVHKVCITEPFYMGKYEVTQGQWQAIMGNNPSYLKKGNNHPVETVSWNDVQTFIRKLNAKTGKHYRLPTEAEWEYAAKAGSTTKYPWGNSITCSQASYNGGEGSNCYYKPGGSFRGTSAVGSYEANAFGLYDTSGNVWEWVQDWYGKNYYQSSPANNPTGPSGGSIRVIRGGSWYVNASNLRSANRFNDDPGFRYYVLGFRLSRSL